MHHTDFVHLHLHTQYSLLDGAIRLDNLFSKAKEYKMPAVAMTDHGNMFGAVDFYLKAQSYGLKPIIGSEIYVAPKNRFDKGGKNGKREYPFHLILLAKNIIGYRNLCKLLTAGFVEGFYYKPRVDKELLREHNEGLIALSACLRGEVPNSIHYGNMERAEKAAEEYRDIFSDKRFFLELMDNKMTEQIKVNKGLIELGKKLDIPLVATNDCHYLKREDAKAHDVLLCIQTGKTLDATDRMRFATDEFYFKSPAEMAAAFSECPEAVKNTVEIAERCNLELHIGEHHFPVFKVPKGVTPDEYLEKEARDGLEDRLANLVKDDSEGENIRRTYYLRLERELEIIKSMGYSSYFLIVADFIHLARNRNIPVGPGRGSAAGSLVAYALRITGVDPIAHGLLFERFLNPERISLPDIDIDFCIDGRDEVIKYVSERYGVDNVAQIITFGKMQAKAVIRDVGRVMNIPYGEVDAIAKLIPQTLNITIEEAVKQEKRLKELISKDPKIKELIELAKSLEGLLRHASTHAAGVVISNKPLTEYLPLYKGQKEGIITTQYAMNEVEKIGLLKFDFLGLKTLTVIDTSIKLIKSNRGKDIEVETLPLDDPAPYKLLSSGITNGIFQLESSGVKELITKLKPECFEDIIAMVALYRPGPLGSGMVEDFIKRKHGRTKITYALPELKEILENTYGVIVYQEQVMQIAITLANFSPGDADILRRAMGKKKPEEMEEQKEKFLIGAKKNKLPIKKAEKIFDLMAKFAGYGFNKSHSAAYAYISYSTAYLKAHYPVEFMTALLTSEMSNTDKVMKYIGECKDMGIEVLPPDVNESFRDFTAVGEKIRFGLAAVKNVGASSIDTIVITRDDQGSFHSLNDFCAKADLSKVNKRVVESLIKAGAFDFTSLHRSQLFASLDRVIDSAQSFQKDRKLGQESLFANETLLQEPEVPQMNEWPENQLLSYEHDALGFYITGHPLNHFSEEIKRFASVNTVTLSEKADKVTVTLGGVVSSLKEIKTKKGDRMAFVTLEDIHGSVEVILFSDVYHLASHHLQSDTPIMIIGSVDKGENITKVIAKEVFPLSHSWRRFKSRIFFNLNVTDTPKDKLFALKDLIRNHPGDCRTFLKLLLPQDEPAIVALPSEYKVEVTKEIFQNANELLGYDAVTCETAPVAAHNT